LGNGPCPQDCGLYRLALDLTREFGENYMRNESRAIMTALPEGTDDSDVKDAMADCALEPAH